MDIFTTAKRSRPHIPTKTGIILGMGETNEESRRGDEGLRAVDVDILTLGQYLRPSDGHIRSTATSHRRVPAASTRSAWSSASGTSRAGPLVRFELSRVGEGSGSGRMTMHVGVSGVIVVTAIDSPRVPTTHHSPLSRDHDCHRNRKSEVRQPRPQGDRS
jgi:hypothetical protein